MKCVVPVTHSCHKKRAIGVGVVFVFVNVIKDVWIGDRRLYMEDLHEAPMSSSLNESNTNLRWVSHILLKNCLAMYSWAR
jgi:hypothetical protein